MQHLTDWPPVDATFTEDVLSLEFLRFTVAVSTSNRHVIHTKCSRIPPNSLFGRRDAGFYRIDCISLYHQDLREIETRIGGWPSLKEYLSPETPICFTLDGMKFNFLNDWRRFTE